MYIRLYVSHRSGCAIRSLDYNGKTVELDRVGGEGKMFSCIEYHKVKKAAAKAFLTGTLDIALLELKALLGEGVVEGGRRMMWKGWREMKWELWREGGGLGRRG